MDTLSSSVSTLKVPSFNSTTREFYQFKTPPSTTNHPPQPYLSSTTKPNSISTKTTSFTHKTFTTPFFSPSQTSSLLPSSPTFHRKPASGYAAALIDVAQSNSSLDLVQSEVQRLLKLLQKGQAVRQVAEQGRFHRHLLALLKMLVKKNKVGIVQEVLEEFERIYDKLCGTQVVLVSSPAKIVEEELLGIAKRVQQLSGAAKVKVRNLIHEEGLPSYAV
ncbi:ATP synthase delta chain, chloroplastic [Quillaja saponaria]|uniref:ATP synthase delta chain, chloroplastic n=1 Tax=Quillaja saponaria TaxID=32244 RepID=A0AAD7PPV1_QUISA|nr:ATP synthase delta chain, chloroplastic [Quillaja saponaria]KAJ7963463.1 ATP synthase delta chain, chloroplastic [Quillaja saponaria]